MDKECVGVDIGTTYSIVTYNDDGIIKTHSFVNDGETVNSLVVYNEDSDQFYYGFDAKTESYDSDNIVFKGFKMLMNEENKELLKENRYIKFTPEEITEKYINYVIKSYLRNHKIDYIDELYIGVPEIWFQEKDKAKGRTILKNIFDKIKYKNKKAIGNIQLIAEPEAACACFVVHNDRQRNHRFQGRCLVVDYGGGTLDIALCNVENQNDISDVTVEACCGIGANSEGKIGKAGLAYVEEVAKLSLLEYFKEEDIVKDAEFYKLVDSIERRVFFDQENSEKIDNVFEIVMDEENINLEQFILNNSIMRNFELCEDEFLKPVGKYHKKKIELKHEVLLEAYKNVIYRPLKEQLNLIKEYMDKNKIVYSFDKVNNSQNFRVLMVGGFCNYYLVRKQIENHFDAQPNDIRFIYQEKEPQKAISLGLGYLANGLISFKRVAPYDIGIATSGDINKGIAFKRGEPYKVGVPKFIMGGKDRTGRQVYQKFGGNKVPKIFFNNTKLGEKNIAAFPPTKHLEEMLELNPMKVYNFGFSLDQNQVFSLHKIEYDVDDTKIGDDRFSNPKETVIELTDIDDWFGGIRVIL